MWKNNTGHGLSYIHRIVVNRKKTWSWRVNALNLGETEEAWNKKKRKLRRGRRCKTVGNISGNVNQTPGKKCSKSSSWTKNGRTKEERSIKWEQDTKDSRQKRNITFNPRNRQMKVMRKQFTELFLILSSIEVSV